MAHQSDNLAFSPLALPPMAEGTVQLAHAAGRPARWAERAIARTQPLVAIDDGADLMRRFDAADAPGVWATTLAQRFVADTLPPSPTELVLALYAPPQRHISTARQGALAWSRAATPTPWAPHEAFAQQNSHAAPLGEASSAAPAAQALARSDVSPTPSSQPLLGDLEAIGWGSGGSTVPLGGEQVTPGTATPAPVVGLQRSLFSEPSAAQHDDMKADVQKGETTAHPAEGIQKGETIVRPADAPVVPLFPTAAARVMRLTNSPQIDPLQRMGLAARRSAPTSYTAQRLEQPEQHEEPLADTAHMVPVPPLPRGEHTPLPTQRIPHTSAHPLPTTANAPLRLARWADQSVPPAQPDVASTTPAHATPNVVGLDENELHPPMLPQPILPTTDPNAGHTSLQEQRASLEDAPQPNAFANNAAPHVQFNSSAQQGETHSTEEKHVLGDWHHASPAPAPIARNITVDISPVQHAPILRAADASGAVQHAQQTTRKHSAEHNVRRDAEPSSASSGSGASQSMEGTTQHSTSSTSSFAQRSSEPFAAALVQRYATGVGSMPGGLPLARSFIVPPFALFPNRQAASPQRANIAHAYEGTVDTAAPATADVQPTTAWQEAHPPSLEGAMGNTSSSSATTQRMAEYAAFNTRPFPLLQRVPELATLTGVATFAAGQQFGQPWMATEQVDEHGAAHAMDRSIATEQPSAPLAPQLLRRAVPADGEDETEERSFPSPFTLLSPRQRAQPAAGTVEHWPAPPMALLHPQRAIQRAPAPSEASAPPSTTSAPAASAAAGTKGGDKPDVDALARQVYARLRRRLLVERERLGR